MDLTDLMSPPLLTKGPTCPLFTNSALATPAPTDPAIVVRPPTDTLLIGPAPTATGCTTGCVGLPASTFVVPTPNDLIVPPTSPPTSPGVRPALTSVPGTGCTLLSALPRIDGWTGAVGGDSTLLPPVPLLPGSLTTLVPAPVVGGVTDPVTSAGPVAPPALDEVRGAWLGCTGSGPNTWRATISQRCCKPHCWVVTCRGEQRCSGRQRCSCRVACWQTWRGLQTCCETGTFTQFGTKSQRPLAHRCCWEHCCRYCVVIWQFCTVLHC